MLVSVLIIQYNGRDNEGVDMAHDKISPKNLPRFLLMMT